MYKRLSLKNILCKTSSINLIVFWSFFLSFQNNWSQTNVTNNTLDASAGTNTTIEHIMANTTLASFASGKLSNVALFNSALISSQVQTLYNNGTPEAAISHSPVSWWKLDNTTTGLIDNGSESNNGTNNGATGYAGFINTLAGESVGMDSSNLVVSDLIKGNTGYTPYTLSLDAANSNLFNCGNNNSLRLTTAITISAWVKYTTNSTLNRYAIVSRENSTSTNYRLVLQNDSGTARTVQFISGTSFSSTGTVARNEWTHVAVAVDGSNINIYINGVRAGSSSSFAINSVDDVDFEISNSNYSNSYFPGAISILSSIFAARSIPDDPSVSYFGREIFLDNLLINISVIN